MEDLSLQQMIGLGLIFLGIFIAVMKAIGYVCKRNPLLDIVIHNAMYTIVGYDLLVDGHYGWGAAVLLFGIIALPSELKDFRKKSHREMAEKIQKGLENNSSQVRAEIIDSKGKYDYSFDFILRNTSEDEK
jgi:hypothetical protein